MLEKFHLRGAVGNQDPGDLGVGKVRGGEDFFPSSRGRRGGGLTMDDTMKLQTNDPEICSNLIFWKRVWN